MVDDEDRAPSPLLNEFEKFPEYLEIELKPHAQTLPSSKLLTAYNKFALNQIFDLKTRELIHLKSFPIILRIYLVPKLNVLTISKQ
jgi:hypothetical protein